MIFTLIVFLLIVVFMAFFIGKNLQNVCTLLLFKTFENIPASVLVLLSFAAGIVFCILIILIMKFKRTFSDSQSDSDDKKAAKFVQNSDSVKTEKKEKTERKLKKIKEKVKKVSKKDKKTDGISDDSTVINDGGLLKKAEEVVNVENHKN